MYQKRSHTWLAATLTKMNQFFLILGRSVAEKVSSERCLIFPPCLTIASVVHYKNDAVFPVSLDSAEALVS